MNPSEPSSEASPTSVTKSSEWPGVATYPEIEHILGFRLGVRPWVRGAQVEQGSWWAELFGSLVSNESLARLPWMGLQGPVVCLQGGEAALVSSSPRTLIPMALFRTALDAGAAPWHERRRAWPAARGDILAVHRALGGQDDLQVLESVLMDADLERHSIATGLDDWLEAQRCRARILARLDPEPRHRAYRQYLQSLMEVGFIWPPPPALGPWYGTAASAAFTLLPQNLADEPAGIACALAILRWPAGLGLCHSEQLAHIDLPGDGQCIPALERAAALIVEAPRAFRDEPHATAIESLAAGDHAATVRGYLAAASSLQARGRNSDAWHALLSATFWQHQTSGVGDPALAAHGLKLCRAMGCAATIGAMERILAVHSPAP